MKVEAKFRERPLNVVQVVNTLALADGGPARNAYELNEALNYAEGCSASIFWINGSVQNSLLRPDAVSRTDVRELSSKHMRARKFSWFKSEPNMVVSLIGIHKLLRSADVLILHGYYLPWIPFFALLGKMTGCEVFLTPHGSLTARQQKYSVAKKKIFDLTLGVPLRASLSAFVTGSGIEREELMKKFPAVEVQVGGVGVQMPQFYKRSDVVHRPLRLLSMSRIAEKKRLDISIDTMSVLKAIGVDASLTVAGSGRPELEERLRSRARRQGVDERVHFVGQLSGDAKHQAFMESDVFLLPSDDENFGIGFAEAMAHGLPSVVSANVASATDMPKGAGELLVAPNPESMADAILAVIETDRYRRSQELARQFAESEFSWSSVAAQWLGIFEGCRKKGPQDLMAD